MTQGPSCQLQNTQALEEDQKLSLVKTLLCFIGLKTTRHLQTATCCLEQM